MNLTEDYIRTVSSSHRKKFGQYFTPLPIATFMSKWVSECPSVLDPAVGNNVFFELLSKSNNNCTFTGFEIDSCIFEFFHLEDPSIRNEDFLLSEWNSKYDGIICNPPYNRFQSIKERDLIFDYFEQNTGVRFTRYTNQCILFLIKCIYQLKPNGKLAFIIPNEFLNSKYGDAVKNILIERKLISSIINFKQSVFDDALTTCCILLLDYSPKNEFTYITLNEVQDISTIDISNLDSTEFGKKVSYLTLKPSSKWINELENENNIDYAHLVPMKNVCKISRGLATGDNDYFLFNESKRIQFNLKQSQMLPCVSSSKDIPYVIFDQDSFNFIKNSDKTVYVLKIGNDLSDSAKEYLNIGIELGVDKKYLPAHRKIWYEPENKKIADIWITSASRNSIKVVYNSAGITNLTSFHGIYINPEYARYKKIIFCYLLTPIAQSILCLNKKEMGNGLTKFQPNDYMDAKILNPLVIKDSDLLCLEAIFDLISYDRSHLEDHISELNSIFLPYLNQN